VTSYRDHQKELKRPDELQKLGQQAVPWLEQHGKNVVVGVVTALLVTGAILVYQDISSRGEDRAAHELAASIKVMSREVTATPSPTAATGEAAPFKTEADRDEVLLKQLTEFRKANVGRRAAGSAALPAAEALLRSGKPAEALPLLEEYLKVADPSDVLRPAAFEAKGYALEAQQKYDEALSAFDQLARENKTDFLKGMGLYHRARILALKGDKDGAAKQFVEVEASAPNSAAARLAKERIALLASQGVTIPAPPPLPMPMAVVDAGT
jgi:tetratricopeptide (TPR) repeat protein